MESQYLIQQLYLAYFGRPADPGGLSYWTEQLQANGGNLDGILSAFGDGQEFIERYAGQDSQTLVNNLYQQLFGRDADAEGLAYYTGRLDSGDVSLAKIAATITQSARGDDMTVIENRVAVAEAFTREVQAGNVPYGAEQVDAVSKLVADVNAATDVTTYLNLTFNELLASLAEGSDAPGTGASPRLEVDDEGNASASGDLSGYDLSNVTGTLSLQGVTVLPTITAHLPAAVDVGIFSLVLEGTLDISDVVLSSRSGTVDVDIYEHADIAMTSAQYQQIEFGQVGQKGTQQHIRFTDSMSPDAIETHHYVETYRLSDAGQTITVGQDRSNGGEIFGGNGDDTMISINVDETWYFPAGGDDTLDFTNADGESMVAVGPNEGDDMVFGFNPSSTAADGDYVDSAGFLGVANVDEVAASIASITFISNGQTSKAGLVGSTNPGTPVDMRIVFDEGGTLTFVDFLAENYDFAALGADSGTLDAVTGDDLNTLFGEASLQFEHIA